MHASTSKVHKPVSDATIKRYTLIFLTILLAVEVALHWRYIEGIALGSEEHLQHAQDPQTQLDDARRKVQAHASPTVAVAGNSGVVSKVSEQDLDLFVDLTMSETRGIRVESAKLLGQIDPQARIRLQERRRMETDETRRFWLEEAMEQIQSENR